jgi:hypothetical protein
MSTAIGQIEVIQGSFSRPANGTINKGDVVKVSTLGRVVSCSAITDAAIGVALATVADAQSCPIQNLGVAIVKAKNSISEGDQLMPSTSTGQVSTASGATAVSVGIALAAAADGEFVACLLDTPAVKRPPNT